MTIQQAYQQLFQDLFTIYESREAANIADLVIEKITGQQRLDRILYKDITVNAEQQSVLEKMTRELVQHKPVQYAIGEAWFMDMKLMVNEHVLIPRPETEELVDWLVRDVKTSKMDDISVLDIGTGSGCIPIAVKKNIPHGEVWSVDVSEEALQLAKRNAAGQNVLVDFLLINILEETSWNQLGQFDIIVSNPPYIKQSEKAAMQRNVLDFEPHIALFVLDEDPLLFYHTIARFCQKHLKKNGRLYVEINEVFGMQVTKIFSQNGFTQVELRKDMQGRDRMIKALKADS